MESVQDPCSPLESAAGFGVGIRGKARTIRHHAASCVPSFTRDQLPQQQEDQSSSSNSREAGGLHHEAAASGGEQSAENHVTGAEVKISNKSRTTPSSATCAGNNGSSSISGGGAPAAPTVACKSKSTGKSFWGPSAAAGDQKSLLFFVKCLIFYLFYVNSAKAPSITRILVINVCLIVSAGFFVCSCILAYVLLVLPPSVFLHLTVKSLLLSDSPHEV